MANPGLVVTIDGDAKGALTAIEKTGDALGKLPGEATKAARGVGDSAQRMSRDIRSGGDDIERSAHRVDDAFDRTGESAFSAATQIGEAMGPGGDAASAVGGFTNVLEEVSGSFGPIGVAAAVAGAAILSGVAGALQATKQRAEDFRAKVEEMYGSLIEGKGKLDQAYADQQMQSWIRENRDLAKQLESQMPGSLKLVNEAMAGNEEAYRTLTAQVEQQIGALNAQRSAGGQLRPELQRQYDALVVLQGQLQNNSSALGQAREDYRLYGLSVGNAADEQARLNRLASQFPGTTVSGGKGGRGIKPGERAAGGPVTAGAPYVVGEYGKELFIPAQNGTIVPNGAPAAASVTVIQNITTGDPMIVAARTAEALRRYAFRNAP
jgi:hypothetical protein